MLVIRERLAINRCDCCRDSFGSIICYRYDGNKCLAVVDGEPVSLVDRSHVVDLIEAVNAIVLKCKF